MATPEKVPLVENQLSQPSPARKPLCRKAQVTFFQYTFAIVFTVTFLIVFFGVALATGNIFQILLGDVIIQSALSLFTAGTLKPDLSLPHATAFGAVALVGSLVQLACMFIMLGAILLWFSIRVRLFNSTANAESDTESLQSRKRTIREQFEALKETKLIAGPWWLARIWLDTILILSASVVGVAVLRSNVAHCAHWIQVEDVGYMSAIAAMLVGRVTIRLLQMAHKWVQVRRLKSKEGTIVLGEHETETAQL